MRRKIVIEELPSREFTSFTLRCTWWTRRMQTIQKSQLWSHSCGKRCRHPSKLLQLILFYFASDLFAKAVPETNSKLVQTQWFGKVNSSLQTKPLELDEEERNESLMLPQLVSFIKEIMPVLHTALEQNETMNVFRKNLAALAEDDILFGNKADNFIKVSSRVLKGSLFFWFFFQCSLLASLSFFRFFLCLSWVFCLLSHPHLSFSHQQEFQSFTDFEFSKGKMITALDWKPDGKGGLVLSLSLSYVFSLACLIQTHYCALTSLLALIHALTTSFL